MRPKDIADLTPSEIKNKFALPEIPTHISEVRVPSGTYLQLGVAGPQDEWGEGGAVQYQILDKKLNEQWFSNPIPIHEYQLPQQTSPLKK